MKSKIKKFSSLFNAKERALAGEETAQRCIIGTLSNLGCEHLADGPKDDPKWLRHYRGFSAYLMSMVGEYGMDESQAERDLLDELNSSRDYSDHVSL